jgi:hypothetical protein
MATLASAARRLVVGASLIILATTADAQAGDANALRGMAQAEKDAGRVSSFRVVEHYHAIGVTTAPPAARASPEAEAETARIWAERFCADASRDFKWSRRWRLIVYPSGQAHRSFTCVIANAALHLEPGFGRKSTEDPIALDESE